MYDSVATLFSSLFNLTRSRNHDDGIRRDQDLSYRITDNSDWHFFVIFFSIIT
jgi:hypothetical protein